MNKSLLVFCRLWPWGLLLVFSGVVFTGLMARRGHRNASPSVVPAPLVAADLRDDLPPKAAVVPNWDEGWQRWLGQLANPGRDSDLAAEFEALVAADPARAFAKAQSETDPARRTRLLRAVLVLWAQNNSAAAAAQAALLPDSERADGVAAVLGGASNRPSAAVKLATEFCRNDPSLASEHGYALVNALGRVGAFREAIRFSVGEERSPDDEDHNKWLKATFAQWAAQNPTAAIAAIQELPRANARFEALDAIAESQVRTDPVGLTEALQRLPAGSDRNLALGQTLQVWVNNDPKTASEWLDRLDASPDLDPGAAALAVATQSHTSNSRPEVALSWGESIVTPELRSRTLTSVVQKWAELDRSSALRYVQSSRDLLPEDQLVLVKTLTASGP